MNKTIAIYPGTFDPITIGHLDIIERASSIYEKVYVTVGINPNKSTFFSVEDRLDFILKSVAHLDNVFVEYNDGLIIEFAKRKNAKIMIRGLRAVTDFEYELQIASANMYLDRNIETIFMMTRSEYSFISSSNVKEMAFAGADISGLVPFSVNEYFKVHKRR